MLRVYFPSERLASLPIWMSKISQNYWVRGQFHGITSLKISKIIWPMPVVSDTTPILNLSIVEHLYLLQEKFGEVVIPVAAIKSLLFALQNDASFYLKDDLYSDILHQAGED